MTEDTLTFDKYYEKNSFDEQFIKVKNLLKDLGEENKDFLKGCSFKDVSDVIDILEKQCEDYKQMSKHLSNANARSAELMVDLEDKNSLLENANKNLAKANAHASELMAEIELKNEKIQMLNAALANANAEASELISEIEYKKEQLEKAHQELNLLNRTLEKKVEERTKKIKHLLDQKNEFINQLSHDLKTPLTPIISLIEILDEDEMDSDRKNMYEIILRNSKLLLNVVKKTIRLIEITSTGLKINKECINFNNFLDEFLNKFDYDKNKFDILFDINNDQKLSTDKKLLFELFNHLISNSIKFSPNGGKININGKIVDDYFQVSIKDEGIGMTQEQLSNIFDEFYKTDSSRHDLNGSGLGLSICKKIIDKLNGEIWAESKGEGKGSTFYLKIPN